MNAGEYIKQLRTQKGLSQEELGKIIGVQRAAVQKWESGKTKNLKRATIQKLANYFNVNPIFFLDHTEFDIPFFGNIFGDDPINGSEIIALIEKYTMLDDISKSAVDNYIDFELVRTLNRQPE